MCSSNNFCDQNQRPASKYTSTTPVSIMWADTTGNDLMASFGCNTACAVGGREIREVRLRDGFGGRIFGWSWLRFLDTIMGMLVYIQTADEGGLFSFA